MWHLQASARSIIATNVPKWHSPGDITISHTTKSLHTKATSGMKEADKTRHWLQKFYTLCMVTTSEVFSLSCVQGFVCESLALCSCIWGLLENCGTTLTLFIVYQWELGMQQHFLFLFLLLFNWGQTQQTVIMCVSDFFWLKLGIAFYFVYISLVCHTKF